jgi:hypothetical protein
MKRIGIGVRSRTVNHTELPDFEDWVKNADFMLAGPIFATNPFFGSNEWGIEHSHDRPTVSFPPDPSAGRSSDEMVAQSKVAYLRDRPRLVVLD